MKHLAYRTMIVVALAISIVTPETLADDVRFGPADPGVKDPGRLDPGGPSRTNFMQACPTVSRPPQWAT